MGPAQLFNHLWTTKYAAAIASRMELEAQRKAESFVDTALTVCGEEIRLMTPRDLLYLDGFENPFVTNKRLPDPIDCAFFIWTLSVKNRAGLLNSRRQRAVYKNIARRDVAINVGEIEEYCSRVFIDVPPSAPKETSERKPPGVYFLAGLLANLASDMGSIDPMSGELLADTPIPRLLQYVKSVRMHKDANEEDVTEFDSARNRCMEEVNLIMDARRAAVK